MSKRAPIGVMGCLPRLPDEFPLSYPENSGNMVHANAPLRMFDSAYFIKDHHYPALGYENFAAFVNARCSHLVVTLANTLKLGETDNTKYQRLLDFLSRIEKPVVVFGLGIQSKDTRLDEAVLPPKAIELIQHLSTRAPYVGVRGEFTKQVLEKLCGIRNAFVTGCPSIFSNPDAFKALRANLASPLGRPAFSGTKYFEEAENRLLIDAVQRGHWLIEPVNKFNHQYHLKVITDSDTHDDVPYFLKSQTPAREYGAEHPVRQYFLTRYRLFRNVSDWYKFNADAVSCTYGTRFHVNMASLVSGKPALWLTHDARTRELVEFMHLPHVDVNADALQDTTDAAGLTRLMDYEAFFDHLPRLHNNFNHYLESNGLPTQPLKL